MKVRARIRFELADNHIELLTIAEAARLARCKREVLDLAMRYGELAYVPYSRNTRRILKADLKRWVKKRRIRLGSPPVPAGYAAAPPR